MDLWYPFATRDPQQDGGEFVATGPYRGVLHSTESSGYPSYRPGTHPHFTVWLEDGRPRIRQHVPLNRASRALRNEAGGVQTNRQRSIQIEIAMYAREADRMPPELRGAVARLMRWIESQTGIQRKAPTFKPYPASYGVNNGVRLSGSAWEAFNGWCGHQHVPENTHGDPGALDISYLLNFGTAAKAPVSVLVQNLQVAVRVSPKDGIWGAVTDRGLGVVRTAARGGDVPWKVLAPRIGSPARWRRKAALKKTVQVIQRALKVADDGVWGPKTDAAFLAARKRYAR